jgi:hypothetical protein
MVGLAGPVIGIFASAILFDRIGGYTSEKAIPITFAFGFASMIFGLSSVMFANGAVTCAVFIMLELFCGAFVLPSSIGIMLT